jgi:hypothetical protein
MRLIYFCSNLELQLRLYLKHDYCINGFITKGGLHVADVGETSLPPERLIQAGWKEATWF